MCWGGVWGSYGGKEGPSAGDPHLSQPHPCYLIRKLPPPPTSLNYKVRLPLPASPACLPQQQEEENAGRDYKFMGRAPLATPGHPPHTQPRFPWWKAMDGLYQAPEVRRRKRRGRSTHSAHMELKAGRRGSPPQSHTRSATFHSQWAGARHRRKSQPSILANQLM